MCSLDDGFSMTTSAAHKAKSTIFSNVSYECSGEAFDCSNNSSSASAICQFFQNILRLLMASKEVLVKLVVFEQFLVLGQLGTSE